MYNSQKSKAKSETIQIRLDSALNKQIAALASERQVPLSALLRDWIVDRLKTELRRVSHDRSDWRTERLATIQKLLESGDFAEGPVLVVQGQPLTPGLRSTPDWFESSATSLAPIRGRLPVYSRINRDGYEATCSDNGKLVSKGQAFRTSQLELIYSLEHKGSEILGLKLDEIIVLTISSFIGLLSAQQFPLPFVFSVSLLRVKDSWLVKQPSPIGPVPTIGFQEDSIIIPDILITDYSEAEDTKALAKHIQPVLDEIWNASGIRSSLSFGTDGIWMK